MDPVAGDFRDRKGRELPRFSGREICDKAVELGLWKGTPEQLWNMSVSGELWHIGLFLRAVWEEMGFLLDVYTGNAWVPVTPEGEPDAVQ